MRLPRSIFAVTLAFAAAGCSDIGLRHLQAPGPGPDEFSVLPVKPLTQPKDYAFLPAPTPGGGNLTDPNPKAEAVAALGGNAAALNPNTAIPSTDAALVTATSRYGVPANARQVVNAEDARVPQKAIAPDASAPVQCRPLLAGLPPRDAESRRPERSGPPRRDRNSVVAAG